MAEKLLQKGFRLSVYNRTIAKAEPLAAQGAQVCVPAEEAVREATTVLLTLTDYAAIAAVLTEVESLAGKFVLQMGTIAPEESRELAREIGVLGGTYLEAPILGSRSEIEAEKLIIMVGGEREHFQSREAFLKTFGPTVRYIGEIGQAAALKLALNQIIAAHACGFSLSLGLVQKNGVAVDTFSDILRTSSLYAPMYDKKLPNWVKGEYKDANFPTKHLLKDAGLVLAEARRSHLSTEVMEGMHALLAKSVHQGLGEMDYSAVFETVKKP